MSDEQTVTSKPRYTVLRWLLFLPAGLICGFIASSILYYVSFFILRLALFFAPGWFIEGIATVVNGWSLGGFSVATAGLIAPSHRKVVAVCVAVAIIFVAGGVFILGVRSANTMMWVLAVAQAIGACVGATCFYSRLSAATPQRH